MNINTLTQYATYFLMALGAIAFLVSVITQVIKEMPLLQKIQTNVVALVTAMILCPVSVIVACMYFRVTITWYYVFASFIAAFIVYLISTSGWEKVHDMWSRSKYKKEGE